MHSLYISNHFNDSFSENYFWHVNLHTNQRGTKKQVYNDKSFTGFSPRYYFCPKTHISSMWFATLI